MNRSRMLTAIVPCNNLDASEAFYKRLGFSRPAAERPAAGEEDTYRTLTDATGAMLHLCQAVEGWLMPGRNPFGLYYTCQDVDALAAALPSEILESDGPTDKPWGMYEFAVSDPDSTLVRIGWPTSLRRGQSDRGPRAEREAQAMPANRSMPHSPVIPVLGYSEVGRAVNWLCSAFQFSLRLRIGDHRAQLNAGEGALVIAAQSEGAPPDPGTDSVMIRVSNLDDHHDVALRHGAAILEPPADQPYGERQYVAADFTGRRWIFSQSIADVDPADWGGEAAAL